LRAGSPLARCDTLCGGGRPPAAFRLAHGEKDAACGDFRARWSSRSGSGGLPVRHRVSASGERDVIVVDVRGACGGDPGIVRRDRHGLRCAPKPRRICFPPRASAPDRARSRRRPERRTVTAPRIQRRMPPLPGSTRAGVHTAAVSPWRRRAVVYAGQTKSAMSCAFFVGDESCCECGATSRGALRPGVRRAHSRSHRDQVVAHAHDVAAAPHLERNRPGCIT